MNILKALRHIGAGMFIILLSSMTGGAQVEIGGYGGAKLNKFVPDLAPQQPQYQLSGQGGLVIHQKSHWLDSIKLFFQHEIGYNRWSHRYSLKNNSKSYNVGYNFINWSPNVKVGIGNFIDIFAIGGPRLSFSLDKSVTYPTNNGQKEVREQKLNRWQVGGQIGAGSSLELIALHMRNPGSMPTKSINNISPFARRGTIYINLMYYRSFTNLYRDGSDYRQSFYLNIGYIHKFYLFTRDPFR